MRLAARLTLGLGLALVAPAWAGSCFCLVAADRTPYYDCVEGYRGLARSLYIECRRSSGPTRVEIPDRPEMTRVAAGTSPCELCEGRRGPPIPPVMRPGDDGPAAPAGHQP
jgi:hypothetical protein